MRRPSGYQVPDAVRQKIELFREHRNETGLAAYLVRFHARMYYLSVKQRFTKVFNRRHGRKGTLWEDRFNSVLVEEAGDALAITAAYMDLDLVRAVIVKDPERYGWSGYSEAMAGRKRAKFGLQAVVAALQRGREETAPRSLETYCRYLYLEGDERRETVSSDGGLARGALSAEEAAKVLTAKGRLPLTAYLRCRVRYFCDGAVLGGRDFVEDIFRSCRDRFGPNQKPGARPMRGLADQALFTARDLRVNVFGVPSLAQSAA